MSSSIQEDQVWETLRGIPDPEFGVNIVDLGLIYDVHCGDDGTVHVVMTLTTPSCPSGGWIYEGAKEALVRLAGAEHVDVKMVFDPSWTPAMLSESAQRELGRIP